MRCVKRQMSLTLQQIIAFEKKVEQEKKENALAVSKATEEAQKKEVRTILFVVLKIRNHWARRRRSEGIF